MLHPIHYSAILHIIMKFGGDKAPAAESNPAQVEARRVFTERFIGKGLLAPDQEQSLLRAMDDAEYGPWDDPEVANTAKNVSWVPEEKVIVVSFENGNYDQHIYHPYVTTEELNSLSPAELAKRKDENGRMDALFNMRYDTAIVAVAKFMLDNDLTGDAMARGNTVWKLAQLSGTTEDKVRA